MRRIGAALLATAAILLLIRHAGQPSARGEEDSSPPNDVAEAERNLEGQGVASCASTACHHGNGPKGAWRSEYTTWVTHDPHARAYALLFETASRKIITNLNGPNAKPATENPLCLSCHVTSGANPANRFPRLALADGVGCESCHGPAEKWLKTHYLEDWKRKSSEEKAALGFHNTKNLAVRAQICATCHVGCGDRDVNHDLIAAGHPRLRFEFGAYLANLPKHWDEKKDREGRADFDAQVWVTGQVVSMRTALQLLQHRASASGKPWPEFAEYDCFACHHDLADQKWRRAPKYLNQRQPGSLPWGTWYYSLTGVLAQHPPRAGLKLPEAALAELGQLMSQPYRDANKNRAGKRAGEAAQQLADWLPSLDQPLFTWNATDLASLLDNKVQKDLDGSSWDQAVQLYLALAAQQPTEPRRNRLSALWRHLEFPPKFASPRGFDPNSLRDKPKNAP